MGGVDWVLAARYIDICGRAIPESLTFGHKTLSDKLRVLLFVRLSLIAQFCKGVEREQIAN
jgi:hypothetical protein